MIDLTKTIIKSQYIIKWSVKGQSVTTVSTLPLLYHERVN